MQAHPANQRGANCQPSGLPVVVAGYQWFPEAAYICQLNLVIGCFKWLRVLVVTAVSLCPQTRIGMGEEQVKWGSIIDCLPWEESNSSDALREWGTFMFKSLNFVFFALCCFSHGSLPGKCGSCSTCPTRAACPGLTWRRGSQR